MDIEQLEKLGFNRNEAKVYLALVRKGRATAAELVKAVGVHRNIIYDNLEKLVEKGLASFIVEGTKRLFIAEDPAALIEFLKSKRHAVDASIVEAQRAVPQIKELIGTAASSQDATIFRGIQGLKKVLGQVSASKEYWSIGVTNESVLLLGDTYWKNFNTKIQHGKVREHLLWNANFRNNVQVKSTKLREHRVLPANLNQVTEIMLFNGKTAIVVYSASPIVIVMEDKIIFTTFRKQFDFLWQLSKAK